MSGPELVFLHIPKTAGTSQQMTFNEHYGEQNIFWIGKDCSPDVWRYPRARIGDQLIIGGHKRLAFYPRDLDPLYCAILRDPVERAISLYVYYTRPELALQEWEREVRAALLKRLGARGMDPASMTNSIRRCRSFRREISNYQCRYLSRGRATLAGVTRSLQDYDSVIGTVHSYDRFHRELGELLDWTEAPPVQANRSVDNYAAPFLADEALVALLRDLNKEDEQLVRWVEQEQRGLWLNIRDKRQRRRRLHQLPLRPGKQRARQLVWEDAPELWPPRAGENLPWPLKRMMVAEPCRLVYMPNPGPADVAVQRMMLSLSSVRYKEAMLEFGINRVVEQYATGLLLDDHSKAEIEAIGSGGDYFKFALVYEPVGRLVDIYQQRFVEMREVLSQWPRLYQLAADVQGRDEPDLHAGISFRQFARAVMSGKHKHQLWQPQLDYLPWSNTYNRFYRPDQLSRLEQDLARVRGLSVRIERPASGLEAVSIHGYRGQLDSARYVDTPAGELPADPALWRDQLVDEALYAELAAYYAADFKLYNLAAENDLEVAHA